MTDLNKFGGYQTNIPDKTEEQKQKQQEIDTVLSLIQDIAKENKVDISVRHDNKVSINGLNYFDEDDLMNLYEHIKHLNWLDKL